MAAMLSVCSVSAAFYTIGKLNAQQAETRIIREDLSDEQAKRLADAEARVRELALRDKRIMAQTIANRQLILALRGLIEARPDLFVGVDLPPILDAAKPLSTKNPNPPKPSKPKPNKPKPNKPTPGTHGPDPRSPTPPAATPVPPTNPIPNNPVPPVLPVPPSIIPPGINPIVQPIIDPIRPVVCLTPLVCMLVTGQEK